MTNAEGMTKPERVLSFGHSSFFRHSSFGFRHSATGPLFQPPVANASPPPAPVPKLPTVSKASVHVRPAAPQPTVVSNIEAAPQPRAASPAGKKPVNEAVADAFRFDRDETSVVPAVPRPRKPSP